MNVVIRVLLYNSLPSFRGTKKKKKTVIILTSLTRSKDVCNYLIYLENISKPIIFQTGLP